VTSGHFELIRKHPQIFTKYPGKFALRASGLVIAVSVEKTHKPFGSFNWDA
jgi:hypothetical protein